MLNLCQQINRFQLENGCRLLRTVACPHFVITAWRFPMVDYVRNKKQKKKKKRKTQKCRHVPGARSPMNVICCDSCCVVCAPRKIVDTYTPLLFASLCNSRPDQGKITSDRAAHEKRMRKRTQTMVKNYNVPIFKLYISLSFLARVKNKGRIRRHYYS